MSFKSIIDDVANEQKQSGSMDKDFRFIENLVAPLYNLPFGVGDSLKDINEKKQGTYSPSLKGEENILGELLDAEVQTKNEISGLNKNLEDIKDILEDQSTIFKELLDSTEKEETFPSKPNYEPTKSSTAKNGMISTPDAAPVEHKYDWLGNLLTKIEDVGISFEGFKGLKDIIGAVGGSGLIGALSGLLGTIGEFGTALEVAIIASGVVTGALYGVRKLVEWVAPSTKPWFKKLDETASKPGAAPYVPSEGTSEGATSPTTPNPVPDAAASPTPTTPNPVPDAAASPTPTTPNPAPDAAASPVHTPNPSGEGPSGGTRWGPNDRGMKPRRESGGPPGPSGTGKYLATGGIPPISESTTSASDATPISKVIESGAGYTVITKNDGSEIKRTGGSKSWRNNNPGNIRGGNFAKSHGAIGIDSTGYAVFPTKSVGEAARADLLFGENSKYKNLTVSKAIERYAPPSENPTRAYQDAILKALDYTDIPLKDLSEDKKEKMLAVMEKFEGYKVGKEEVINAPHATFASPPGPSGEGKYLATGGIPPTPPIGDGTPTTTSPSTKPDATLSPSTKPDATYINPEPDSGMKFHKETKEKADADKAPIIIPVPIPSSDGSGGSVITPGRRNKYSTSCNAWQHSTTKFN